MALCNDKIKEIMEAMNLVHHIYFKLNEIYEENYVQFELARVDSILQNVLMDLICENRL
jgi:hypothetical protein